MPRGQGIDLLVGALDLPFDEVLLMVGFHFGPLFIEGKHPLDQGDHFVMEGNVCGVGEVDGADERTLRDNCRRKLRKGVH